MVYILPSAGDRHDRSRYAQRPSRDTFQPVRGLGSEATNRHRAILITYAAKIGLRHAASNAADALNADFVVGKLVLKFLVMLNSPVDETIPEIAFQLNRGDQVPHSQTEDERQQD